MVRASLIVDSEVSPPIASLIASQCLIFNEGLRRQEMVGNQETNSEISA